MDRITIVVVHHTMKRGGGSEQVVYDMFHGLDRQRFRPVLCCLYGLGELGAQIKSEGFTTYEHVIRSKFNPCNVFRVAAVLKRERADIMYVTDGFHNAVLGRLAALLARIPLSVIIFHTFDRLIWNSVQQSWRRKFVRLQDLLLLRHFHRAIALGQLHKKYLMEDKQLSESKISVVYNGIDLSKFARPVDGRQIRRELQIPEGAQVVGMVAGLRRWKSHDVLFNAAVEILRERPETYFLLAGDGPERDRLERLARELNLTDRVRFLGVVADVPALLRAFDVTALSSAHEAFPLSLLESMAVALPVVATDVGSVSEIVDDGVTGLLVPPARSHELAQAVLRLLRDPALGQRFGEAGRRKVEQNFTVERMARRCESLFLDWASAARGSRSKTTIRKQTLAPQPSSSGDSKP
jgi:glycosyltransferase involved in cell wall biosynthesis